MFPVPFSPVSISGRWGYVERVVGDVGFIVRFIGGGSQFIQRKHVPAGACVRGPLADVLCTMSDFEAFTNEASLAL